MSGPDKTPERGKLDEWTAKNPRDELTLKLFAGWVNCPVNKLPPTMRGHTCPATMEAWGRVAAVMITEIEAEKHAIARAALEKAAERITDAVWLEYRDSIENKWVFRKEHVDNGIRRAIRALMDDPAALAEIVGRANG